MPFTAAAHAATRMTEAVRMPRALARGNLPLSGSRALELEERRPLVTQTCVMAAGIRNLEMVDNQQIFSYNKIANK
jgi:hypothetical protein